MSWLFDMDVVTRSSGRTDRRVPGPDVARLERKLAKLPPVHREYFPRDLAALRPEEFWYSTKEAGRVIRISDDTIINHIYDGSAFRNTLDVSRVAGRPVFRIPLEDLVDFFLERLAGAWEPAPKERS